MVATTSHIFSGKVDIASNLQVGSSHLFVDTENNRVGITTIDPHASLHVNGNVYAATNVIVGTDLTVTSNATVGADLTVTGNVSVSDGLTVTGNVSVSDDLTVTGNVLVSDDLTVTGNVLVSDDLTVTGNALVSDDLTVTGGVTSTTSRASNVVTIGTTKTFVVTVQEVNSVNKYFIDGIDRPTLQLHQHQTYIFDLSSSTLSGHPFIFSETASGSSYDTGITSTGGYATTEKRTFVVPVSAPTTLYYYCTSHPGMGDTASISPTAELIVSGRVVASGTIEAVSFVGSGSQLTGITSNLDQIVNNGNVTSNTVQFTNATTGIVATGNVHALKFIGDGSQLTGITSNLNQIVNNGNVTSNTLLLTNATTGLVATGNVEASKFVGDGSLLTGLASNLHQVTENGNVTSNTLLLTNATTGLVATGNVHAVKFIGSGSELTDIATTLQAVSDNGNVTSNTLLLTNATTGLVATGNVHAVKFIGSGSELTDIATTLQAVSDNGNVTSNTLLLTNATTGLVATGNVHANYFMGDGSQLSNLPSGGVWDTNGDGEIYFTTSNVGISNADPGHNLSVGSNLYIDDDGSNVLVITGNAAMNALTLGQGQISIVPSYGLDDVLSESNISSNTMQLTNVTTGLVTTGNVSVGNDLTVTGDINFSGTFNQNGAPFASSPWTTTGADLSYTTGNVSVGKDLTVTGNALVSSNLTVAGNVSVSDDLTVTGNVSVSDDLTVTGNVSVSDDLTVTGNVSVSDDLTVAGNVSVSDDLTVTGNVSVGNDLTVTGDMTAGYLYGDVSNVTGITSNLHQIAENGNVTSNTLQFTNATTGFVTTANVEVGGELTVSSNLTVTGNATVSSNLTVTGNATVSSNLTVTGNVLVSDDLTVTGNVSDLNIVSNVNMLHTSNTASIKLNSNVVTEFPRSKKLMKFPRVALTGPSAPTGYAASASTALGSGWEPYRAFNTIAGGAEGWHDQGSTYSTGVYTGSNSVTPVTGSAVEGEWIQIQLPGKIKLEKVRLAPRETYTYRMPKDATILGSINGTDWYRVTSWSGQTYLSGNNYTTIDVDSEQYYNYYVLVVEALGADAGGNSVNIGEWELYGTPEYDPEAHGVDVVVKSVPNVPNTDWLEVYYDAKNYTSGVVQDLSTNSFNGTLTNGASYNNSDGISKFAFDAGTNQYMTTTTDISGEFIHTTSMWVKFVEVSTDSGQQHYLFMLGAFGSNSIGMYYSANQGIRVSPSGFDYRSQYHPVAGNWFHVSYTYAGGAHGTAAMNTTVKFYINGKQWNIPAYYGNTSTVTLPSSSVLQINGSAGNNNTLMDMEVGNFRVFNRALTSDEIYQLYAYQKEYFGHGVLGMTLKAGRLGIGTSEPKAALDVRGDIIGGCPVLFDCVAQSTTNVGSYVDWNLVKLNKGDGLSGTTFTAPVAGHYFFHVHGMGAWTFTGAESRLVLEWHKNGVHYGITQDYDAQMYDARDCVDADGWHMKLSGSIIAYLEIGETIKVIVDSTSTSTLHGRYNRFTGHYIG
jgi:predicted acyltransferase (DUF342 family)